MEEKHLASWDLRDKLAPGALALLASKAAGDQGDERFLNFHLEAFRAKHDAGRDLTDREVLKGIAKKAGLDLARFDGDMSEGQTLQALIEDHMEGREKHGLFGVPTLVFPEGTGFLKLGSLPESLRERTTLFEVVHDTAVRRPYLLEFKRP